MARASAKTVGKGGRKAAAKKPAKAKKAAAKAPAKAKAKKAAAKAKPKAAAAEGPTPRADLSVFNRYIAKATGDFKAPQAGRKATKDKKEAQSARMDKLEAQKENLTAAQYLRKKQKLMAAKPKVKKTEDLRARFLEALPRVMEAESWTVQDLQEVGVPYKDLVELGLRKPRGPRAGKKK